MRPRITPQGVLDAEVASTFYLRIVYKVLSILVSRRAKAVRGSDELVDDSAFRRGMSGIRYDGEPCLRPRLVKIMGVAHRRDYVVAPVHDDSRKSVKPSRIAQELSVDLEESAVHEVMRFDSGERQRIVLFAEAQDARRIGQEGQRRAFPLAPYAGEPQLLGLVAL